MNLLALLLPFLFADSLPPVTVDRDDIEIRASCRLTFVDRAITDDEDDGVVHVTGDDLVVEFDGTLRGAPNDLAPDELVGTGVRITGRNVTLRQPRVSGYRVAVHASGADGLVIQAGGIAGNFRQRLGSTETSEDDADWLRPHENDDNEWLRRYGAAIYVEDAVDVTIHGTVVRDGQNGIVLDRVARAKVFDNDCSFLSGWGLALWRSSDNLICRNAFDFCVRGYSHGVYNRGQDSAGILLFEQCCRNVIAENSATHGGDGFFAFAGREALGEASVRHDASWHLRRGNNDNLVIANDFSYAVAHGLELTFSFGNRIHGNRLVGNAICGIWGGYSQDTLIAGNRIRGNGDMGYGPERGGINIEHGRNNRIEGNQLENACDVRLWWDQDEHLRATPWAAVNRPLCADNVIRDNEFTEPVIELRRTGGVTRISSDIPPEAVSTDEDSPVEWIEAGDAALEVPGYDILGNSRPVGARHHLSGREHIVMTTWGPHDWRRPLLRRTMSDARRHRYRVLGATAAIPGPADVEGQVTATLDSRGGTVEVVASPEAPAGAVIPYSFVLDLDGHATRQTGVLADLQWRVSSFPYETDPRDDIDQWRAEGRAFMAGPPPRSEVHTAALDLRFGHGGPADLPPDRFGTIAAATFVCLPGRWRIRTASDDGIRVWLDGELVIDDWTWHPPKAHAHEFEIDRARMLTLRVEHFELDGYAVLSVEIESAE